jgi:chloramphenicol O-acetyltransferase
MALSVNEERLREIFKEVYHYWEDFEEFKEFYIKRLNEKGQHVYYTPAEGEDKRYDAVNHYPDTKRYEVWVEGYAATGESGKAHLAGTAEARNFADACHKVFCRLHLESMLADEKNPSRQYDAGRWDYDPTNLTYWGCALFDNERDARRSFG